MLLITARARAWRWYLAQRRAKRAYAARHKLPAGFASEAQEDATAVFYALPRSVRARLQAHWNAQDRDAGLIGPLNPADGEED